MNPGAVAMAQQASRVLRGATEGLGRLARALALAPLSQRGLALGAALAVLLPFASGSAGLGLGIAALVGGGVALMGLPRAFGWSEAALLRVGSLALASGLIAMIALTSTLTVDPAKGQQLRVAVAIAAAGGVLLPPLLAHLWPALPLLLGPFTATAWAVSTVFAGAAWLLLGFTWPLSPDAPPLMAALILAVVAWAAAFLLNRLEASRGLRGATRLLALRSGLVRLGGLVFGGAVAILAVPRLEGAAWRAAFATPLEGIAPMAGMLAGALLALAAAGVFFALPGLLARRQLAGMLGAAAAGEAAWALALVCGFAGPAMVSVYIASTVSWFPFVGAPVIRDLSRAEVSALLAWTLLTALAAFAHGAIRLLLGRVTDEANTPLWLVLPGEACSPAAISAAQAAARGWDAGPVTLLAPPAAAPQIRGPHLRLAQAAGTLADLFARSVADAAGWQRGLPAEAGRAGLPLRELYCAAPAAAAILAGLPTESRVLVLADGPLAAGWGGLFASLPPNSLRVAREERFIPRGAPFFYPEMEPDSWRLYDFADRRKLEHLLTRFYVDHRPREAAERRILILHGETDRPAAERLAGLLNEQTDAAGRPVVASALAPPASQGAPLGWSPRTWVTLWAFFLRAVEIGEYGPLRQRLLRVFFGRSSHEAPQRLDLAVLEYGLPHKDAQRLAGPERWADAVLALVPATPPADAALLFEAPRYTARLTLPPPSALEAMLPIVAEEILSEAYAAPAMVTPTSPHGLPVFLSDVSEYAHYRDQLEDALRARGLDLRSDRSLTPGEQWREALAKHLDESRILVALAGPATATSRFASTEIETAIRRGLLVVPVIVAPFEEPAVLLEHQRANRHYLADLDPEALHAEIAATADAIARLVEDLPATPPEAPDYTASSASSIPPDKGEASESLRIPPA